MYSPLSSLNRMSELDQLLANKPPEPMHGRFTEGLPRGQGFTPSRQVGADEARQRVARAHVDLKIPDAGIPEAALDELISRKQQERMREFVISQAPKGFVPGALRMGAAIGASMLDPINIAASFIPVVGPTRYAAALERAGGVLGRAGVRAGVGALEGVVGQAAVEPIVYTAAQAEQADYDLTDSVLSIAMGTIMGAGLHVGAGAIGDALGRGRPWQAAEPTGKVPERITRWSADERAGVGRTAVAQAVSGRKIDIEPLVELRDSVNAIEPQTMAEARFQVGQRMHDQFREQLLPEAGHKLSRGEAKRLQQERADLQHKIDTVEQSFKDTAQQIQKAEKMPRKKAESLARKRIQQDKEHLQARVERIDTALEQHKVASAAEADISRLEQGIIPDRFKEQVDQEARKMVSGHPRTVGSAVRQALGQPERRVSQAWDGVRTAAGQQSKPEASAMADFEGAAQVHDRLKAHPAEKETLDQATADMEEEVARLQELADNLGVDVEDALRPFDEEIEKADTMGNALKALAGCQFRRTA